MRLIDSDELLSRVAKIMADKKTELSTELAWLFVIITTALYAAPTVDAVEVVRCKDCKHFTNIDVSNGNMLDFHWCGKFRNIMGEDDFCSCGERRCE